MSETDQLVTFTIAGQAFGIDVRSVQEILRSRSLTPVPLAHPAVAGLLNLRGQIVTVIDLRERLGIGDETHARSEDAMNVVVRSDGGPVSLRVDAIGEVIDVDPASYEPPARVGGDSNDSFVSGLYKLPERVLHILSVEKVLEFSSQQHSQG